MNKLYFIFLFSAFFIIYACNGGSSNSSSHDEKTASSESSAEDIDLNKYSDSKGVGQFKEVQIAESIDDDMAAKGNELFQTQCTACHNLNNQKMIGPGLKDITKIRTPEWIMNMITDPDKMLSKDPVAIALLKEFNNIRMTNQGIGKEQARQIYEFLRQNDAD